MGLFICLTSQKAFAQPANTYLADALGNFTVNSSSNLIDYRFKAANSGAVTALEVYCNAINGTVPSFAVSIYQDNGSGGVGTLQKNVSFTPSTGWNLISGIGGLNLSAGVTYHIVISSATATTSNFASFRYTTNALGTNTVYPLDGSPYTANVLTSTNGVSSLATVANASPPFVLFYQGAAVTYEGIPYANAVPATLSSSGVTVGEQFVITATQTVNTFKIYMAETTVAPNLPVSFRFDQIGAGGVPTLLYTGLVANSTGVGTSYGWIGPVSINSTFGASLSAGTTYALSIFSPTTNTANYLVPMEDTVSTFPELLALNYQSTSMMAVTYQSASSAVTLNSRDIPFQLLSNTAATNTPTPTATLTPTPIATSTPTACGSGSGLNLNWSTQTSLPVSIYAPGVAAIGTTIYVIGGYSTTYLNTVYAYDTVSNSWSTLNPMPTARSYLGVGVVNGLIYAIGGLNSSSYLGTVEVYNPSTNIWTSAGFNAMTTPREIDMGVVNGVLYAVGGYNNSYLNTVEAYNPIGNSWTTEQTMPTARDQIGVGVVNGILYAIGGGNSTTNQMTTVESYNPVGNSWTTGLPSMPVASWGPGVVVLNGSIYVVGGSPSSFAVTNTVQVFNPAGNSWSSMAPMPTGRELLGAAVVNGNIYAVGGATGLLGPFPSNEEAIPACVAFTATPTPGGPTNTPTPTATLTPTYTATLAATNTPTISYLGNQSAFGQMNPTTLNSLTTKADFRFTTGPTADSVNGANIYCTAATGSPSYSIGIQPDAGGSPSGGYIVSAAGSFNPGWNSFSWTAQSLNPNTVYHLVVSPVAADSIDYATILTSDLGSPVSGIIPVSQVFDPNFSSLTCSGSCGVNLGVPVFLVDFSSGNHIGNPYDTVSTTQVYGTNAVAEVFPGPNSAVNVNQLGTYFDKQNSPDNLFCTLSDITSTPVTLCQFIYATSGSTFFSPSWVDTLMPGTFTLSPGHTYQLLFSSPGPNSNSVSFYKIDTNSNSAQVAAYQSVKYQGSNAYEQTMTASTTITLPYADIPFRFSFNVLAPTATPQPTLTSTASNTPTGTYTNTATNTDTLTATATPTGTIPCPGQVGYSQLLGGNGNQGTGFANCYAVTVPSAVTVTDFQYYAPITASGSLGLALYTDNAAPVSSQPQSLLTNVTITSPVVNSWNVASVTSGVSILSPGKYWLVYNTQSLVGIELGGSSSVSYCQVGVTWTSFPLATMPTSSLFLSTAPLAFFMDTNCPATATPTPTSSFTPTLTPTATISFTFTDSPTITPTSTPSNTQTSSPTNTATVTATLTPTFTPTLTPTATCSGPSGSVGFGNPGYTTTGGSQTVFTTTAAVYVYFPGTCLLTAVQIVGSGSGNVCQLGLYDDNGSGTAPTTLIGSTAVTDTAGTINITVNNPITVMGGKWMAFASNSSVNIPSCTSTFPFVTFSGVMPASAVSPATSSTGPEITADYSCMVFFTPTVTPTNTATSTATNTGTFTPTFTNTATNTGTNTATNTASVTPTNTPTFTNTATNTGTNTDTNTATATATNTATNTATATFTNTATATATNTATLTPTFTNTTTNTGTNTATSTATTTFTYTATATATNTSTFTPTFTNTATNTETNTATSTATATFTNTATATVTSTATNSATASATNTPTSTASYTPTLTPTASATSSSTFTNTATNTATKTATVTATNTGTFTATGTATNTATLTPTNTATSTATATASYTATFTATPSPTSTNTATSTATKTPTLTPTDSMTPTASFTATSSASPTATSTLTNTATPTASATPTSSATSSFTATPSGTPTNTPTLTSTSTATSTATVTSTFTATSTPSMTATSTSTFTPSNSPTFTLTFTPTLSPTFTWTPTITFTPTVTPTFTPTGSMTATPTPNVALYLDENFFNPNQQQLGMDLRVDVAGQVKVMVFNMAGEEVEKLLDQTMNAGNYRIYWDGHNSSGALTGNSVYYIVVQQPSGNLIRKVIVLK